jgi:opacity protein-like surface antigen
MKKFILAFFLLITTFFSQAQLEVGLFAGGSFYMGDINPNKPFLQTNIAYGILGRYPLGSRWAVKINVYKGILSGNDKVAKYNEDRSLEFKSSIWELGGVVEFNFLPYFTGSLKNYFTPYIFAGAATLYHRPQIGNLDLRDYRTENTYYSYYAFSIPFGIGVKYSFSKRIAATLEWGMRKTFTDYIDDVSTTYYIDPNTVQPGTVEYESLPFSDPNRDHLPGMQRGNSRTNDWYSFAGLTLTYNINMINRNKCSEYEERY